jgi:outer membrane lipoprotein SlyB
MPSSALRGIAGSATPNYTMEDILRHTRPANQTGGFRRVLGAVAGGVGNVFLPGIGGVIGSAIAGGAPGSTGLLGSEPGQFLELQRAMQMEIRAFELASTMLKVQHDSMMSITRNIK